MVPLPAPGPGSVFVKRAGDARARFTRVPIFVGDAVTDLAERASLKLEWRTPAAYVRRRRPSRTGADTRSGWGRSRVAAELCRRGAARGLRDERLGSLDFAKVDAVDGGDAEFARRAFASAGAGVPAAAAVLGRRRRRAAAIEGSISLHKRLSRTRCSRANDKDISVDDLAKFA